MDEVEKFIQELKDPDPMVRRNAAFELGDTGDARAVPALIATLMDYDKGSRIEAARALGEIGDATAVPALINALKHECAAAEALVKIGEPAVPALIDKLANWSASVRKDVIWALWKIGDGRALGHLLYAWENEEDEDVKDTLMEVYDEMKDAKNVPALIDILRNDNALGRDKAAELLGEIGDKRAVPALIEALKLKFHHNLPVRLNACKALGEIGDARAVPALIEALKGSDFSIRWRAVNGLGSIGNARAVSALIEALKDEHLMEIVVKELIAITVKTDLDLKGIRASLKEFVEREGKKGHDEKEKAKQEAAAIYAKIAADVAKIRRAQMPGILSSGTVPEPSGKKGIYRMRRAANG